ncbi:MAG: crosslink repair DNA glycosylase YcaQ family protein [Anaerolineales bacterium]|nr:crosslink repair DNA glycosylase YcaQ family protein [Anaerolineales bacterium]
MIPVELIQAYQVRTFRITSELRLRRFEDAVEFVSQRGFALFWPVKGIRLPSLWVAAAGDRPVADEHDDPGHITWNWKDSALGKRYWYYGKVIAKKATLISLDLAPCFYALSENYGSPDEDYLTLYEQGRLTQEARQVYEALLREGPLDTLSLKRAARLTSRESDSRFNKAITDLQADFKIAPVGVARVGGWNYAFVYELTGRAYPDIVEQARHITEREARQAMALRYLESLGAVRIAELARVFSWRAADAQRTADSLVLSGHARAEMEIETLPGTWLVLAGLAPLDNG